MRKWLLALLAVGVLSIGVAWGGGQERQNTQGLRGRNILLLLRQVLPEVASPAREWTRVSAARFRKS
jgi:hypothetical protein